MVESAPMYRLVERDGVLHVDAEPSGFALERRQAANGGAAAASTRGSATDVAAVDTTTTTTRAAATTTTTQAAATTTVPTTTAAAATTTTTTQAAATTTPQATSAAETTSAAAVSSTQPDTAASSSAAVSSPTSAAAGASTTSSPSSTGTSSASPSADTTITRVITPTTVIVVGTSTFTSSLSPITSAETLSSSSQTALPASSGSGLSTGAIAGIAVGSAIGGILALSLLGWLCLGAARRRRDKRDADNILWPATGDSSALYPEPVHNTGRAGFGIGDDGDELDDVAGAYGGGKAPMSEVGAGAAGVGAAALGAGALGRYGSQREQQQSNMPPAVYTSDYGHTDYNADPYYGGDASPPEAASAYTGYSNQTPSQHSHSALAPGMAGAGFGGAAAAYEHRSPSPPRFGSADGHMTAYDGESQGGHMPFPGEADFESPERSFSPRPMQVGDTFGQGYDETEGGKRWRLSVVNDDPLDRD